MGYAAFMPFCVTTLSSSARSRRHETLAGPWCQKLQHKQAAIDSKQGWLLAFWFIGLPLLVVLALKNSSIPPTIEQQIFWAVVILGATAFAIVLHRRLHKEELENIQQRQKLHRMIEQLENRMRSFE